MRAIVALAILLLGASRAAHDPKYYALLIGSFNLVEGTSVASSVDIESSIGKGDRLVVPALAPPAQSAEPQLTAVPETPGPPHDNPDPDSEQPPTDPNIAAPILLRELCNALLTSAQDNNLPIPFFANLIWQESGLQKDTVSAKGAMGIAQFMPQTAAEHGLGDPLDPLQAISASARLLRELRGQFGNLGLVAAAYNAGARRVGEWLEWRRKLPRETLSYVVNVTGRSVEQWQKTPADDAALRFVRRLPCRNLSAFAELEQAQSQQTPAEHAREQRRTGEKRKALEPKSIGERKRENMTLAEERALLNPFAKAAGAGEMLNIRDLKAAYQKAIGHDTSNSTVYNLLARHGWRKLMPRPFHPKRDVAAQNAFNKTALQML